MVPDLLTVVVPTRDRGDISECLGHLAAQAYRPLEVVVVDQSGGAGTLACFERFVAPEGVRLRYLGTPTVGLDRARNIGLEEAQGEWIAFVDDDCLVETGWAEGLVATYRQHPQAGMVFGRTLPFYPEEEGKRTRISIKDWPDERVLRTRWSLLNSSGGMGGNMSLSRECFSKAGGFEPLLDVGTSFPGAGDLERTYRTLAQGFAVVYTPTAICLHKRWLHEEDYQRTERGYARGRAAAWTRFIGAGDDLAALILLVELGGRFLEIAYHLALKRNPKNVRRAFGRLKGFLSGIWSGFRTDWNGE